MYNAKRLILPEEHNPPKQCKTDQKSEELEHSREHLVESKEHTKLLDSGDNKDSEHDQEHNSVCVEQTVLTEERSLRTSETNQTTEVQHSCSDIKEQSCLNTDTQDNMPKNGNRNNISCIGVFVTLLVLFFSHLKLQSYAWYKDFS